MVGDGDHGHHDERRPDDERQPDGEGEPDDEQGPGDERKSDDEQGASAGHAEDFGATEGTFLVTHAAGESAVLKDVHSGQVHTLSSNPGLDDGDVVEGSVAPDPPLEVTYEVVAVDSRRHIPIEESEEPPTTQERGIAAAQPTGELTQEPRAGIGEIHVLTVPEGATEKAAADVMEDAETVRSRAARLGVNRVEVRSEPGVVSVRYLP